MKSVGTVRARRMGGGHFIGILSIAALIAPLALGGCQEVGFEASVPPRMAPGVPIAVELIEGPPAEVASALNAALAQAAAEHQVTVVDDTQAPRFRLKGYVTASVAQDGKTALAYVWDVFDASNRRLQRVTGTEETAGDPADPWSRIDGKALQRLAGKSMDGIADFLANAGTASSATLASTLSPRAVTAGAATGASVGTGGKPLGYASPE
jgi:hypothetical protein